MTKEASESQPLSTQTNDQKGPERNYSFNEFLKPTYLIVGTSIPMLIGAYAGYKSELSRATSSSYSPGFTSSGMGLLNRVVGEEIMASNKNNATKMAKAVASSAEHAQGPHVNIPRLAVKALGVGSLLSIGGFSFLTFVVFKATGSDSLDELIHKCRKWTPKKRKEFEQTLGINPKSMQHEDVKATQGMSDDEEWEFLKKKYIPELLDEANNEKES